MESPSIQLHEAHQALIQQADRIVTESMNTVAKDPAHPIYHVTPAARFMNDPNGPVWHKGRYHLFFQHLPYWGISQDLAPCWGHVSSTDMVHWHHEPIAIMPGPEPYDSAGVASGCCVIHNGVPTIIYTGVGSLGQTQCLATSDDEMKVWRKHPGNPVISHQPELAGLEGGFRDPCCWKEHDGYRLLIGSGFKDVGGTVLLYRSTDLINWEFLSSMCKGMGEHCFQWECPAFFTLKNKAVKERHVLIVSPLFNDNPALRGEVQYAVGRYDNNKFDAVNWQTVDYGGPSSYYAPSSFEDPKGRRILWGWVLADRSFESKWSHAMTLPRVITLGDDAKLRYEPVPETKKLRRNEQVFRMIDTQGSDRVLLRKTGINIEIEASLVLPETSDIQIRFNRNNENGQAQVITISCLSGYVEWSGKKAPFLSGDNGELALSLYVDGCIAELYIGNTACISAHLPVDPDATGISITTHAKATVKRLRVWDMGSIW